MSAQIIGTISMPRRSVEPWRCPGFALLIDAPESAWNHFIGGRHSFQGADCPNCNKPLLQYLSIDANDPRLNLLFLELSSVSLLYCMRCAVCWRPFDYAFESATEVNILRCHLGDRMWHDWYGDGFGDELPQRYVGLRPIPKNIQRLHRRITRGYEPSADEELEIASFTRNFANPDVGGYPVVDAINQIGGLTFYVQPINTPICSTCRQAGILRRMSFLASLVNDDQNGLRLGYEGVQVLFFVCAHCNTFRALCRV